MNKKMKIKPNKNGENKRILNKLADMFKDPETNAIEDSSNGNFAPKFIVDSDMKDNFAIVKVKNHKLSEDTKGSGDPTLSIEQMLFQNSLSESQADTNKATEEPEITTFRPTRSGKELLSSLIRKDADNAARHLIRNESKQNQVSHEKDSHKEEKEEEETHDSSEEESHNSSKKRGRVVKKVKSPKEPNKGVLHNMTDQKSRRRLQFIRRGQSVSESRTSGSRSRSKPREVTLGTSEREPRVSVSVSQSVSESAGPRIVSRGRQRHREARKEVKEEEEEEDADIRVAELTSNILELKAKLEKLRLELYV